MLRHHDYRVGGFISVLPCSTASSKLPTFGASGQFLDAAATELRLSASSSDREGVKERIASRLERLEARYARRILRGTGVLATIGATAPFVGLFGTSGTS
jgi:biopolymer transport protein ExbB/TolQ